jgi:hypothetical protein
MMFTEPAGPIESFEWGKFQIKGVLHSTGGAWQVKRKCSRTGMVGSNDNVTGRVVLTSQYFKYIHRNWQLKLFDVPKIMDVVIHSLT